MNGRFSGAGIHGGHAPLEDEPTGNPPAKITGQFEASSFCAGNGACVMVARIEDGGMAVRDGKLGAGGPVLTFTGQEWSAFVAGIKAGELQ